MPRVTQILTRTSTLVAAAVAGATIMLSSAGTALADDPPAPPLPPNCTAADLAEVLTGVTAATAAYLRAHPDVNDFFTNVQGPDKDAVRQQIDAYWASHPWVQSDWQAIKQPQTDFRARCGIADSP